MSPNRFRLKGCGCELPASFSLMAVTSPNPAGLHPQATPCGGRSGKYIRYMLLKFSTKPGKNLSRWRTGHKASNRSFMAPVVSGARSRSCPSDFNQALVYFRWECARLLIELFALSIPTQLNRLGTCTSKTFNQFWTKSSTEND